MDREVFLSAAIEHKVGNRFIVGPGDLVLLQIFYSYDLLCRMLLPAHMIYALPSGLQNVMFGVSPPILRKEYVKQQDEHDVRPLLDAADEHCLNCLSGLRKSELI